MEQLGLEMDKCVRQEQDAESHGRRNEEGERKRKREVV